MWREGLHTHKKSVDSDLRSGPDVESCATDEGRAHLSLSGLKQPHLCLWWPCCQW